MKTNVRVILLAGGSGTRFGANIPKQFVTVDDLPIIVYTLRKLQLDIVSGITIVCIKDWIPYLKDIIKEFKIEKIDSIVPGGDTSFESLMNGYNDIAPLMADKDVMIIHDAVRPLLPKQVIFECVEKASIHGNACACLKSIEGLVLKDDDDCGVEPADRYRVMRIQTPQAYRFDFFNSLLAKAEKEGKRDFPYADGMCMYYKEPIYFAKSFTANTKITTKPDIAFFKAMLQFTDEELMGENL